MRFILLLSAGTRIIGIGVGLSAAVLVVANVRAVWLFTVCVNAARKLHDQMFGSLLRAPVWFFDANPSGRILNRFSKDQGFADDLMPATTFDFLGIGLQTLGSVALAGAVNPLVFIPMLPLVRTVIID